jgi:hypothetical protein
MRAVGPLPAWPIQNYKFAIAARHASSMIAHICQGIVMRHRMRIIALRLPGLPDVPSTSDYRPCGSTSARHAGISRRQIGRLEPLSRLLGPFSLVGEVRRGKKLAAGDGEREVRTGSCTSLGMRSRGNVVLPSVASLKALRVFGRHPQGRKPMFGFGDPIGREEGK